LQAQEGRRESHNAIQHPAACCYTAEHTVQLVQAMGRRRLVPCSFLEEEEVSAYPSNALTADTAPNRTVLSLDT